MIAIFDTYVRIFSQEGEINEVNYSENIQEANCIVELKLVQSIPATINLDPINTRDTLQISILESNTPDASTEISYKSTDVENSWNDFVQQYNGIDKEDEYNPVPVFKYVDYDPDNRTFIFNAGDTAEHVFSIVKYK